MDLETEYKIYITPYNFKYDKVLQNYNDYISRELF